MRVSLDEIVSGGAISHEVFDRAADEVFGIMKKDTYPRYLRKEAGTARSVSVTSNASSPGGTHNRSARKMSEK